MKPWHWQRLCALPTGSLLWTTFVWHLGIIAHSSLRHRDGTKSASCTTCGSHVEDQLLAASQYCQYRQHLTFDAPLPLTSPPSRCGHG